MDGGLHDSPLPAAFNRILQVGDASGIQSPVSFGGFGSMTRHLSRLSTGMVSYSLPVSFSMGTDCVHVNITKILGNGKGTDVMHLFTTFWLEPLLSIGIVTN
ncbi:hypothetical protein ACLOJK_004217 [Asimina triloba]